MILFKFKIYSKICIITTNIIKKEKSKKKMNKNTKNAPTTLYLLNSKIKFQQEKKSARPSFNQKKTTRSITQFSKWGKQTSPFKHSKDNSSLKKVILNKNKYSMEPLDIGTKLSQINKIFEEQVLIKKGKNSSDTSKFIDSSDKDVSKSKIARNNESLLNVQYQQTIQTVVANVNKKFNKYSILIQEWKEKYVHQEIDSIIEELISNFRYLFNQIYSVYNRQIINNIQFFQNQINSIAKDYQIQIESLKKQLSQQNQQVSLTKNMLLQINQIRKRGVLNSKIISQLSTQGIDIQNWIRNKQFFLNYQNNASALNLQAQEYSRSEFSHKQQYATKLKKNNYQIQKQTFETKKNQKIDSSLNIDMKNLWKKQQIASNQNKNKEYYKKLNSYR